MSGGQSEAGRSLYCDSKGDSLSGSSGWGESKKVHIRGRKARTGCRGKDRKWVTIAVRAIYQSLTVSLEGGGQDKMNAIV